MEKTPIRLAVENAIAKLPTKPSLPIRGCTFCPKCNGAMHFVLYASNKIEAKCSNGCLYWGDL